MNETTPTELRGWKAVYTIVERPGAEKKYWVRIGSAFVNRDQSLNVRLDAMPVNGTIHIRDVDEEDLERAKARREARAHNTSGASAPMFNGAA